MSDVPHARCVHFVWAAALLAIATPARSAEIPRPLRAAYFHPQRAIAADATADEQRAAVRNALDRMQKSEFNAVFPYFTGSSGQAYYASNLHATRVYGDHDPLMVLMQEARQRGLQVYPVLCVTVCGNDKPAGILTVHPEWALRHPDGTPLGYISPAHPDARQWLASVAREVAEKYQPDGIILDYIRYHNRPLRLDPAAEGRFRAALPTDVSPADEKNRLQQFKEDELTELVRLYRQTIREARPGTKLGVYTWGPHVAAHHQIAQCWPRWVKEGHIDLVNVSGYYHRETYGDKYLSLFAEKLRAARELNLTTGKPVPLSFALGVNTSHGKVHSADDIRDYLEQAAAAQLDGVVFFTWDDLQPFLDALDETGDIRKFPAR